jgi:hypothetical protein
LSALIFVIAVEILACRIRQEKNLKGIQIKLDGRTHSLKLSQLADDTTVFVQSKIEISIVFNIIETSLKKLSLKTNWISEFTKLKKSIPKNWLNEFSLINQ